MAAEDSRFGGRDAIRGAGGGAVAYFAGYLATYALRADAVADALRGFNALAGLLGGSAIPTWKAVGWLFYNAHLVPTRLPTPAGSTTIDLLAESGEGGVLYLLVPLLLVLAGVAASSAGDREAGPVAAALRGAAVTVGYLPFVALGAVLTGHQVAEGAAVGPDLATAILLAGLAYPVVGGALGGVLAHAIR